MKKNLIIVFALFVSILSAAEFNLQIHDTYGDGWNGNYMSIIVNGATILDQVTINDGNDEEFNFEVNHGDEVLCDFTEAGSFGYECEYSVFDHEGILVAESGIGGIVPEDITFFAECTVFDNDLAIASITGPSYANVGNTITYDVVVRNVGNNTISNYSLEFFKADGTLLISDDYSQSLAFEETRQHTLPWAITEDDVNSTVTLYAIVTLANDDNLTNNQSANIETTIFPPGVIEVSVGDGAVLDNKTPICFPYANSLVEMLYFPDEIQLFDEAINKISFQYNFSGNINDEEVNIWIGETSLENLESGFIPANQLTQVYSGTPDFIGNSSDNWVEFQFSSEYEYTGQNLVILVENIFTSPHELGTFNFVHSSSTISEHESRTWYNRDNVEDYDPYSPPTGFGYEEYPNIKFTFYAGPKGSLEGYVYDEEGDPVDNAEILLEGTTIITYTDGVGHYLLSEIIEGEHEFTASKFGYESSSIEATITASETTDQNFTIEAWPNVDVSGFVQLSDNLGTGVSGAIVTLTGIEDYEDITHHSGDFSFDTVFSGEDYILTVTYEGYEVLTEDIEVGDEDLDLGVVVVVELTTPPGNVLATQDDAETEATISWNSPGAGGAEFRYDDGEVVTEVGLTQQNAVLGAAHRDNSLLQSLSWYLTSSNGNHGTIRLFIMGLNNDGTPDQSDILYNSGTVFNVDNQWNTHVLPNDIATPEGFFIGICTNGTYTDIALDDGVGAPYDFASNTHFAIQDYTDESADWIDMADSGFEKNMLIRANGIDYDRSVDETQAQINNRSMEGYNVYRLDSNDQNDPEDWTLVGEAITDSMFVDETWISADEDTYKYAVRTRYTNGYESVPIFSGDLVKSFSGASDDQLVLQKSYNYPNPFNPTTNIEFALATDSEVTIEIYNAKGQFVKTLVNEQLSAGSHQVVWNGTDTGDKAVTSGVYFYKINLDSRSTTHKMLLMK